MLDPGETFTGTFGASAAFDPATHPYLTSKVASHSQLAVPANAKEYASVQPETLTM